jgi:hypothetical protein
METTIQKVAESATFCRAYPWETFGLSAAVSRDGSGRGWPFLPGHEAFCRVFVLVKPEESQFFLNPLRPSRPDHMDN